MPEIYLGISGFTLQHLQMGTRIFETFDEILNILQVYIDNQERGSTK
jgi:hypothetical protein